MHREAHNFISHCVRFRNFRRVLEIGSLNINGSVRDLFPDVDDDDYFGIDLQDGPGVDEVIDARDYRALVPVDLVVCCEVLEHHPDVQGILRSASENLMDGGLFLATCATGVRAPHSAVDGGALREGEHYENVTKERLEAACLAVNLIPTKVEENPRIGDLYLRARKVSVRNGGPMDL